MKIVECVPNISEGKDKKKILAIVSVVERDGVKLLNVSSDESHNRSVITFAGEPEAVKRAAFDLILKAAELIDMSKHKGAHPRMGAVDVCPFVPVFGMSMEECIVLAKELGDLVGREGISGYYYEKAASNPNRVNLAMVREGEYEFLSEKIKKEEWKPDFGPVDFNAKFGVVIIGARDFLIAFNINLKSLNIDLAKKIARIIRVSGGIEEIDGNKIRIPGVFPTVKAIDVDMRDSGGYVQISMNLVDYKKDSILNVFTAVSRIATLSGVEMLNSEIVGLVPADALKDIPLEYLKLKDFNEKKQIIEEAMNYGE